MYINQLGLTIPIIWIKGKLYLIGSSRMSCELRNTQLMVRVGGGYEKFEEYVPKNTRYFQRTLVTHMIKSGESLEWVVDALINGKKIKNILLESSKQVLDPITMKRSASRGSLSALKSSTGMAPAPRTSVMTPTRSKAAAKFFETSKNHFASKVGIQFSKLGDENKDISNK